VVPRCISRAAAVAAAVVVLAAAASSPSSVDRAEDDDDDDVVVVEYPHPAIAHPALRWLVPSETAVRATGGCFSGTVRWRWRESGGFFSES